MDIQRQVRLELVTVLAGDNTPVRPSHSHRAPFARSWRSGSLNSLSSKRSALMTRARITAF